MVGSEQEGGNSSRIYQTMNTEQNCAKICIVEKGGDTNDGCNDRNDDNDSHNVNVKISSNLMQLH